MQTDPVKAADGYSYERQAFKEWLGKFDVSPVTRKKLPNTDYSSDTELKERIIASQMHVQEHVIDGDAMSKNIVTIHELNRVFAHLDPVRSILDRTLKDWRQPQVVVVGQESSGKSTLLERVAMMSIFPRLVEEAVGNTCTRVRIEVQLRNSSEQHTPTLQIINAETRDPCDGYAEPIMVPALNGHIDVRREMDELLKAVQGADDSEEASDAYITDKIIVLRVQSPLVPTIDIIDLPGIRQTGAGADATQIIVRNHITQNHDRSLFLFVNRAGDASSNWSTLRIVEDFESTHPSVVKNGIGVLTMLDRVAKKHRKKAMKVMTDDTRFNYGWVATMNEPVQDEEDDEAQEAKDAEEADEAETTSHEGFHRLKEQARREIDFFDKEVDWPAREQLSTNIMIDRLNTMFKDSLRETWMPGAMKKLTARKEQLDYERLKLGLVLDATEAEKAAAKEAKKRIDAIMNEVKAEFNSKVLLTLRAGVTELLTNINGEPGLENSEVGAKLEDVKRSVVELIDAAVQKVPAFWTEKVRDALTAETTEKSGSTNGTFSFVTQMKGLSTTIQKLGEMTQMLLYKQTKQLKQEGDPLIQLANYGTYTDKITEKCAARVAQFQTDAKTSTDVIMERVFSDDSIWVEVVPDEECAKAKIEMTVDRISNALVGAFIRRHPHDAEFLNLHEGVPLGTEKGEARRRYDQLNADCSDVEKAIQAMRQAFDITQEAETTMTADLVWNESEEGN